MKCTDMWHVLQDIKRREKDDLVEAIKAHGGSYSWYDKDNKRWLNEDEQGPIVASYAPAWSDGHPKDIMIRSVSLDKNGMLLIDGEEVQWGTYYHDMKWSDIFVGHISCITEAIPVPENAPEKTFPVLQLWTNEDIETLQELTNQLMEPFWDKFGGEIDHLAFMETIRYEWLPEFNKKYLSKLEDEDYEPDWLQEIIEFCEMKFNQYVEEHSI